MAIREDVLRKEALPDAHTWWRIAEATWLDPLDPSFAERSGGRWNAPGSFPTLYLNEHQVTARLNLRLFIAQWPYEPQDLRDDTGPVLIGAQLPHNQIAADAHSRDGLGRANLPPSYPLHANGSAVAHTECQAVGARAKTQGLQGVRARAAQTRDGAGRELAWFPTHANVRATQVQRLSFDSWCWG